jgi:hypothetical protein
MGMELRAGELFERLREMAEKRLPKGAGMEIDLVAEVSFPTDEEAHNNDLQAAARLFADALVQMVEAQGRAVWGEPEYRLTLEEGCEVPAWVEDMWQYPTRLVGWRRGRTKVAFAYWEQEDREIPVNVAIGVIPWRRGTMNWG